MKKITILLLMFSMILGYSSFSMANDDSLENFKNAFMQQCENLDITQEIAINLFEKILHGERLDCMSVQYENLSPVEIQKLSDSSFRMRYVYPDGSVKVVITYFPDPESTLLQPYSVTGGSWQSGSGYGACFGAMAMEECPLGIIRFKANYEFRQDGSCAITKVYDGSYTFNFATVTSQSLGVTKMYGKEGDPAIAEFKIDVVYILDSVMESFTLKLSVEKVGSVWTTLI